MGCSNRGSIEGQWSVVCCHRVPSRRTCRCLGHSAAGPRKVENTALHSRDPDLRRHRDIYNSGPGVVASCTPLELAPTLVHTIPSAPIESGCLLMPPVRALNGAWRVARCDR